MINIANGDWPKCRSVYIGPTVMECVKCDNVNYEMCSYEHVIGCSYARCHTYFLQHVITHDINS